MTQHRAKSVLSLWFCRFGFIAAVLGSLVACGGGSSGTVAVTPPVVVVDPLAPAVPVDLASAATTYGIDVSGSGGDAGGDGGAAGSAGDGAPLKNAVVTLTDAKGTVVTGRTDQNGQYLLKFKTTTFTAPYVLRVVDAGGSLLSSVTDEVATTGKVVRINVNPLTDKITSDVLVSSVAGTDKNFDGASIDKTKLAKAKSDLVASVSAALSAAGIASTTTFDPIKSVYSYDGTGVDAVIESLSHTRDPSTGATQLWVKLGAVNTAADGTVTPALVSATTPLPTAAVALPSNPALTFSKLNAWIIEVNRCLALAPTSIDANCDDADGTRLLTTNYRHNSKNFEEDFRTLFSDGQNQNSLYIQGSTLANPVVLFFSRYSSAAGSNVPAIDDLAVVELTVRQPRTGPLAGNISAPIEYTKTLVFKRDDALTRAKAGNWILHGNQRSYDLTITPRYYKFAQVNALKQANVSGSAPGTILAELFPFINTSRYDAATSSYVPANIRAVRVTGPGLPTPGLVMTTSAVSGATGYLVIHNKTGSITAGTMVSSLANNSFRLSGVTDTGAALYAGYWPTTPGTAGASTGQAYADTPVSDFSSLRAFTQYRFEIFLNSNPGNTTPDAIETARILAPISPPAAVLGLPLNDVKPSQALVTPPALAGCSFNVTWINNPNGAAITNAYVYGEERSPKNATSGTFTILRSIVNYSLPDAFLVSNRPSAATVANCQNISIPSLGNTVGGGDYREFAIRSTIGRAQYYTGLRWNN
jgi:hypothetical protein